MSAITLLSLQYTAFNIYKRIRERGAKIPERDRANVVLRYRFVRILYYTIFALLFLYFYIAFMSRDIAIAIFFAYTHSALYHRDTYKIRLFNIRFFYIRDLFQIQRAIFSIKLKLN